MSKRIVVLSPTSTTGGPELLHQLVDSLRRKGADAHICYYPFDQQAETPERYRRYDPDPVKFRDDANTLFVVPESATALVRRIRSGAVAIWWMSVDNHYGPPWSADLRINYHKLKYLLLRKAPIRSLRRHAHFHQSEYARLFLARRDVRSSPLSDYLGRQHMDNRPDARLKRDVIAYNPKKGFETTARLRIRFPKLEFAPIQDMTEQDVAALLAKAKIYIDFGAHPGKDRIPREAAMAGCCVITGRRGSADNPIDIPIPEKYKIWETDPEFFQKFGSLVDDIFSDYDLASRDFEAYRQRTRQEYAQFEREVSDLIETWESPSPSFAQNR